MLWLVQRHIVEVSTLKESHKTPKYITQTMRAITAYLFALFVFYVTVINPLIINAVSPGVSTLSVDSVTKTTARLNGDIASAGSTNLTVRGFEYGTTPSYGALVSDTAPTSYNLAYQWGSQGTGNGQFGGPEGIAKDSAGNIYVVDYNNHRIQKFDKDGNFLLKWGAQACFPSISDGNFCYPHGITIDSSDVVYIADSSNNRIQKFNTSGTYLGKWGTFGSGNGEMHGVTDVAADTAGNIYIVDYYNNRIQKFDSSGTYLAKWGSQGSGDGQFSDAYGIDTDSDGNVYVADRGNRRIQKFNSSGAFLLKFGSSGSGDGQFNLPADVTLDLNGNIYVADGHNHRIQKFSSDGSYQTQWGSQGTGDNNLSYPVGIFTDNVGGVFVSDAGNNRIKKLTPALSVGDFSLNIAGLSCGTTYHYRAYAENIYEAAGGNDATFTTDPCNAPTVSTSAATAITTTTTTLNGNITAAGTSPPTVRGFEYGATTSYGQTASESLTLSYSFDSSWGSNGAGDGQFNFPYGSTTDSAGNVYVADRDNNRIQKFNSSGAYLGQWGSAGSADGQFSSPRYIAVDSSDNIYVTDNGNFRVQKFTNSGVFITKWGSDGLGNGQFKSAQGITIDSNNNVFVADTVNPRVQKFSSTGVYAGQWGGFGNADGALNAPLAIDVDSSGNVYVADSGNHRIQKFDNSGNYITKWGSNGTGDGQFSFTSGVAADGNGQVFVTDRNNHRIQYFSDTGTFIGKWGSNGSGNSQFSLPTGIDASASGDIYVADFGNHRIQKFAVSSLIGAFSASIGSLTCGTAYHVRAYATNATGTSYGADETFMTSACLPPTVTTQAASSIAQTSADLNGNVTSAGSSPVTTRGFEYGTTIGYGYSVENSAADLGTGAYSRAVMAFSCGTTYHFRAFATNSAGTSYGGDQSFSTAACIAPTVSTLSATGIQDYGATMRGQLDEAGSTPVSSRGFEYGTTTGYGQTYNEPNSVDRLSASSVAVWGTAGNGTNQFASPRGLATDAQGNVYIVDSGNSRVQKFDNYGNFMLQWGNQGSGAGQFSAPVAIEVDSFGFIYVVDTFNHRIQKFDSNGNFILQWGSLGSGNGQLNQPEGIAVSDIGDVYIADTQNNRVQKFDSSGNYLSQWGSLGSGNGEFTGPNSITVDSAGNIYVGDASSNQNDIQKFDNQGSYVSRFGQYVLFNANDLAIDSDGYIYAAHDANFIAKFNPDGSRGNEFSSAISLGSGIDLDADGNLYVSSWLDNKIEKFAKGFAEREYNNFTNNLSCGTTYHYRAFATNSVGTSYGSDETFTTSACPAVAPTVQTQLVTNTAKHAATFNGEITDLGYADVTDRGFEFGLFYQWERSINSTSGSPFSTGAYSIAFSSLDCGTQYNVRAYATNSAGTGYGDIQTFTTDPCIPPSVTTDPVSNVALDTATINGTVTNTGDSILRRSGFEFGTDTNYGTTLEINNSAFAIAGQFGGLGSGNGQFDSQASIAVGQNNEIFIADTFNYRIQKLDSNGVYTGEWGSLGSGNGQFTCPTSLAVDTNNSVFVGDYCAERIQKFDSDGNYIAQWSTSGYGRPIDMAIDGNGDLVATMEYSDVVRFSAVNGVVLNTFGVGFGLAYGVAADADSVYIVDRDYQKVYKYDLVNTLVDEWGTPGTADGQFVNPQDITVSGGKVYVADSMNFINDRVQVFDVYGQFLGGWNTITDLNDNSEPISIASGPNENVVVGTGGGEYFGIYSPLNQTGPQWLDMQNLSCNTEYHYRFFAENGYSTSYGGDETFTTSECQPPTPTPTPSTTPTPTPNPSTTPVPDVDLSMTKTLLTSSPISSGNTVTYRLTVTNNGPEAYSFEANIWDVLPDEFNFVSATNTFVDCADAGLGENINPYFGSVYGANHIMVCSATAGPNTLSAGQSFTLDVIGMANSNFVPNITRNRSVMFDTRIESSDIQAISQAVEAMQDFSTVNVNNVANHTYVLTPTPTPTPVPTNIPTPTPVPTNNPTPTPVSTNGPSPTPQPSTTPDTTLTPTPSSTPDNTPTGSGGGGSDGGGTSQNTPTAAAQQPGGAIESVGRFLGTVGNGVVSGIRLLPQPVAIGFPWLLILLLAILIFRLSLQARSEIAAQQTLKATLTRRKQVDEEITNFVSLASHYLNTPLTIIQGAVDNLVSQKRIPVITGHRLLELCKALATKASRVSAGFNSSSAQSNVGPLPKMAKHSLFSKPVMIIIGLIALLAMIVNYVVITSSSLQSVVINIGTQLVAVGLLIQFIVATNRKRSQASTNLSLVESELKSYKQLEVARDSFLHKAVTELSTDTETLRKYLSATGGLSNSNVADGVNRLRSLLDRLETLVRVEEGLVHISYSKIDPATQLGRIAKAFESQLAAKNIALTLPKSKLEPIRANSDVIDFVLAEVLANAIKFTPDSGGTIEITARSSSDGLTIDIADNGAGIPAEKLTSLFKPFSRADNALRFNYEGQGLGLYSCRLILEKYDLGTVEVLKSAPKQGTTVRVVFKNIKTMNES